MNKHLNGECMNARRPANAQPTPRGNSLFPISGCGIPTHLTPACSLFRSLSCGPYRATFLTAKSIICAILASQPPLRLRLSLVEPTAGPCGLALVFKPAVRPLWVTLLLRNLVCSTPSLDPLVLTLLVLFSPAVRHLRATLLHRVI